MLIRKVVMGCERFVKHSVANLAVLKDFAQKRTARPCKTIRPPVCGTPHFILPLNDSITLCPSVSEVSIPAAKCTDIFHFPTFVHDKFYGHVYYTSNGNNASIIRPVHNMKQPPDFGPDGHSILLNNKLQEDRSCPTAVLSANRT